MLSLASDTMAVIFPIAMTGAEPSRVVMKKSHLVTALIIRFDLNLCKMATLKKTKNWFSNQLLLDAGQKYCRMLPLEHSAILLTFIKLPFVLQFFVLSMFEWPFYTGFTITL